MLVGHGFYCSRPATSTMSRWRLSCCGLPARSDGCSPIAYDTNKLRRLLAEHGVEAVIPSIARRKPLIPYDPVLYRQRNLIERRFGRLKDLRRIATRYDKLARNFLAGIALAATLTWWT